MATRSTRRGSSPAAAAGFQEGDAVLRLRTGVSAVADATIGGGTIGTVCRVVNAGRSYMVRYADLPVCVLSFQSSLAPAPPGTTGPGCTPDC
jgi:hypothetical protein